MDSSIHCTDDEIRLHSIGDEIHRSNPSLSHMDRDDLHHVLLSTCQLHHIICVPDHLYSQWTNIISTSSEADKDEHHPSLRMILNILDHGGDILHPNPYDSGLTPLHYLLESIIRSSFYFYSTYIWSNHELDPTFFHNLTQSEQLLDTIYHTSSSHPSNNDESIHYPYSHMNTTNNNNNHQLASCMISCSELQTFLTTLYTRYSVNFRTVTTNFEQNNLLHFIFLLLLLLDTNDIGVSPVCIPTATANNLDASEIGHHIDHFHDHRYYDTMDTHSSNHPKQSYPYYRQPLVITPHALLSLEDFNYVSCYHLTSPFTLILCDIVQTINDLTMGALLFQENRLNLVPIAVLSQIPFLDRYFLLFQLAYGLYSSQLLYLYTKDQSMSHLNHYQCFHQDPCNSKPYHEKHRSTSTASATTAPTILRTLSSSSSPNSDTTTHNNSTIIHATQPTTVIYDNDLSTTTTYGNTTTPTTTTVSNNITTNDNDHSTSTTTSGSSTDNTIRSPSSAPTSSLSSFLPTSTRQLHKVRRQSYGVIKSPHNATTFNAYHSKTDTNSSISSPNVEISDTSSNFSQDTSDGSKIRGDHPNPSDNSTTSYNHINTNHENTSDLHQHHNTYHQRQTSVEQFTRQEKQYAHYLRQIMFSLLQYQGNIHCLLHLYDIGFQFPRTGTLFVMFNYFLAHLYHDNMQIYSKSSTVSCAAHPGTSDSSFGRNSPKSIGSAGSGYKSSSSNHNCRCGRRWTVDEINNTILSLFGSIMERFSTLPLMTYRDKDGNTLLHHFCFHPAINFNNTHISSLPNVIYSYLEDNQHNITDSSLSTMNPLISPICSILEQLLEVYNIDPLAKNHYGIVPLMYLVCRPFTKQLCHILIKSMHQHITRYHYPCGLFNPAHFYENVGHGQRVLACNGQVPSLSTHYHNPKHRTNHNVSTSTDDDNDSIRSNTSTRGNSTLYNFSTIRHLPQTNHTSSGNTYNSTSNGSVITSTLPFNGYQSRHLIPTMYTNQIYDKYCCCTPLTMIMDHERNTIFHWLFLYKIAYSFSSSTRQYDQLHSQFQYLQQHQQYQQYQQQQLMLYYRHHNFPLYHHHTCSKGYKPISAGTNKLIQQSSKHYTVPIPSNDDDSRVTSLSSCNRPRQESCYYNPLNTYDLSSSSIPPLHNPPLSFPSSGLFDHSRSPLPAVRYQHIRQNEQRSFGYGLGSAHYYYYHAQSYPDPITLHHNDLQHPQLPQANIINTDVVQPLQHHTTNHILSYLNDVVHNSVNYVLNSCKQCHLSTTEPNYQLFTSIYHTTSQHGYKQGDSIDNDRNSSAKSISHHQYLDDYLLHFNPYAYQSFITRAYPVLFTKDLFYTSGLTTSNYLMYNLLSSDGVYNHFANNHFYCAAPPPYFISDLIQQPYPDGGDDHGHNDSHPSQCCSFHTSVDLTSIGTQIPQPTQSFTYFPDSQTPRLNDDTMGDILHHTLQCSPERYSSPLYPKTLRIGYLYHHTTVTDMDNYDMLEELFCGSGYNTNNIMLAIEYNRANYHNPNCLDRSLLDDNGCTYDIDIYNTCYRRPQVVMTPSHSSPVMMDDIPQEYSPTTPPLYLTPVDNDVEIPSIYTNSASTIRSTTTPIEDINDSKTHNDVDHHNILLRIPNTSSSSPLSCDDSLVALSNDQPLSPSASLPVSPSSPPLRPSNDDLLSPLFMHKLLPPTSPIINDRSTSDSHGAYIHDQHEDNKDDKHDLSVSTPYPNSRYKFPPSTRKETTTTVTTSTMNNQPLKCDDNRDHNDPQNTHSPQYTTTSAASTPYNDRYRLEDNRNDENLGKHRTTSIPTLSLPHIHLKTAAFPTNSKECQESLNHKKPPSQLSRGLRQTSSFAYVLLYNDPLTTYDRLKPNTRIHSLKPSRKLLDEDGYLSSTQNIHALQSPIRSTVKIPSISSPLSSLPSSLTSTLSYYSKCNGRNVVISLQTIRRKSSIYYQKNNSSNTPLHMFCSRSQPYLPSTLLIRSNLYIIAKANISEAFRWKSRHCHYFPTLDPGYYSQPNSSNLTYEKIMQPIDSQESWRSMPHYAYINNFTLLSKLLYHHSPVNQLNNNGCSPIMLLCSQQHHIGSLVLLLKQYNVDLSLVNAKHYKRTLFHHMFCTTYNTANLIHYSDYRVLSLLLANQLNRQNSNGYTPLDYLLNLQVLPNMATHYQTQTSQYHQQQYQMQLLHQQQLQYQQIFQQQQSHYYQQQLKQQANGTSLPTYIPSASLYAAPPPPPPILPVPSMINIQQYHPQYHPQQYPSQAYTNTYSTNQFYYLSTQSYSIGPRRQGLFDSDDDHNDSTRSHGNGPYGIMGIDAISIDDDDDDDDDNNNDVGNNSPDHQHTCQYYSQGYPCDSPQHTNTQHSQIGDNGDDTMDINTIYTLQSAANSQSSSTSPSSSIIPIDTFDDLVKHDDYYQIVVDLVRRGGIINVLNRPYFNLLYTIAKTHLPLTQMLINYWFLYQVPLGNEMHQLYQQQRGQSSSGKTSVSGSVQPSSYSSSSTTTMTNNGSNNPLIDSLPSPSTSGYWYPAPTFLQKRQAIIRNPLRRRPFINHAKSFHHSISVNSLIGKAISKPPNLQNRSNNLLPEPVSRSPHRGQVLKSMKTPTLQSAAHRLGLNLTYSGDTLVPRGVSSRHLTRVANTNVISNKSHSNVFPFKPSDDANMIPNKKGLNLLASCIIPETDGRSLNSPDSNNHNDHSYQGEEQDHVKPLPRTPPSLRNNKTYLQALYYQSTLHLWCRKWITRHTNFLVQCQHYLFSPYISQLSPTRRTLLNVSSTTHPYATQKGVQLSAHLHAKAPVEQTFDQLTFNYTPPSSPPNISRLAVSLTPPSITVNDNNNTYHHEMNTACDANNSPNSLSLDDPICGHKSPSSAAIITSSPCSSPTATNTADGIDCELLWLLNSDASLDIDEKDYHGKTPLHLLVEYYLRHHLKIAEVANLLAQSPNVVASEDIKLTGDHQSPHCYKVYINNNDYVINQTDEILTYIQLFLDYGATIDYPLICTINEQVERLLKRDSTHRPSHSDSMPSGLPSKPFNTTLSLTKISHETPSTNLHSYMNSLPSSSLGYYDNNPALDCPIRQSIQGTQRPLSLSNQDEESHSTLDGDFLAYSDHTRIQHDSCESDYLMLKTRLLVALLHQYSDEL